MKMHFFVRPAGQAPVTRGIPLLLPTYPEATITLP